MPLSVHSRRRLANILKSEAAADDFADVVDAGSGTLKADTRRRVQFAANNRAFGTGICNKVDAGTALTSAESNALGYCCGSRPVAAEIAAALAL